MGAAAAAGQLLGVPPQHVKAALGWGLRATEGAASGRAASLSTAAAVACALEGPGLTAEPWMLLQTGSDHQMGWMELGQQFQDRLLLLC